jgi:DNA-binding NtrC family response regulator
MKESFDALIDVLVTREFFLEQAVEILEKGMIERVLVRTGNNQSEAAKALGIHRNTLLRKMVQHRIGGKHPHTKPAERARRRPARAPRRVS